MGTRSYIGILNADDSIDYVFCHWDGYPSHQLPILMEQYNTAAKVRKLIAGGSMSSLSTDKGWKQESRPLGPLYHTERGETRERLKVCTPWMYVRALKNSDCEYAYLFVPRGRTLGVFTKHHGWNYHDVRTV